MKKLCFLFVILCVSCAKKESIDPLAQVLGGDHPAIQKIMLEPDYYEVQIIYTQIDTDVNGKINFTDYSFQSDSTRYFYPASTVKLPVAVLALEYLDQIQGLSPLTNYTIKGDTAVHTVAEDVKNIFAISDNSAYNRLYTLLGRDAINTSLKEKGLDPVRIAHRLETDNAADPKRDTLNFAFDTNFGGGFDGPIEKLQIPGIKKGKGFLRNDSLYSEPMDFSEKNYLPLSTLHNLMKRLYFEDSFSETERFHLTPTSNEVLKTAMHTVPRKVGYDEGEFYDSYGKFFIYGTSRGRIQNHIKIYNKVGYAYGTLTETALITDERKDVKFLLSATILVNENGIFNDNVYEYEAVGLPFLAELGRGLYQYELARKQPAK